MSGKLSFGYLYDFRNPSASQRHGVEHITLMLPSGLPPAKFMPYADLFAKEVIPAFA